MAAVTTHPRRSQGSSHRAHPLKAKIEAVKGKYAHVATSSSQFAALKRDEIKREASCVA